MKWRQCSVIAVAFLVACGGDSTAPSATIAGAWAGASADGQFALVLGVTNGAITGTGTALTDVFDNTGTLFHVTEQLTVTGGVTFNVVSMTFAGTITAQQIPGCPCTDHFVFTGAFAGDSIAGTLASNVPLVLRRLP